MYFLDVSKPLSKVIIINFCVPSSKVTTILILLFFKSIDSKLDDLGILISSGNLNLSFLGHIDLNAKVYDFDFNISLFIRLCSSRNTNGIGWKTSA